MLSEPQILATGKLQRWQTQCLLSKARFRILATSRQIGKSLTLRAVCLKEMLETPGIQILYLAPTIKQVKAIGFRPMVLANDCIIPKQLIHSINRTDMTVELTNGSRITFAGTEAIDKLRGLTCDLLILDEYAFMDSEVLTSLNPMLDARNGRAVVASTPLGRNHFYELVQKGILDSPTFTKGFRSWIIPISHSDVNVPNLESRILNARNTLSPEAYSQEYEVSFSAAQGLVYKSYDIELNASNKVLVNTENGKNKALFIGLDFNTAKMVAVVGQEYIDQSTKKRELHIVEEIVLTNTNTYKMAEEIKRRYWSTFKGRIWICPDATGRANKTAATQTDIQILERSGFNILANKSNPLIADRVNTVNSAFCSADGTRRLFIAQDCTETVKSMSSQTYDPKTNQPEKGKGVTDISAAPDALGYLVMQRLPMTGSGMNTVNALGYT